MRPPFLLPSQEERELNETWFVEPLASIKKVAVLTRLRRNGSPLREPKTRRRRTVQQVLDCLSKRATRYYAIKRLAPARGTGARCCGAAPPAHLLQTTAVRRRLHRHRLRGAWCSRPTAWRIRRAGAQSSCTSSTRSTPSPAPWPHGSSHYQAQLGHQEISGLWDQVDKVVARSLRRRLRMRLRCLEIGTSAERKSVLENALWKFVLKIT